MSQPLMIGEIEIEVVFKEIKNVHLSVYPPNGRVRIAAPAHMNLETIRLYAISRLDWIKKQQKILLAQEREAPREYIERESHYHWGRRYLLHLVEGNLPPQVEINHTQLVLYVRPGTNQDKREQLLSAWYREQLRSAAAPIFAKWEPVMGVKAGHIFIQRMKTHWGSCKPETGSIRLNTELAKKPLPCLEYVIVHELTHLLEPSHNAVFVATMDKFMPNWRHLRDQLNQSPLAHEDWEY